MLFTLVRSLMVPFEKLEKYIPQKGRVLDIGCGHGIFSDLLAQKSISRKVLGIDPSKEKIAIAQKTYKRKNLAFKAMHANEVRGKFDAIVIIDVLYLLPIEEKKKLLNVCQKLLRKNGILLIVINGKGKGVMHKFLFLEEFIMTKVLRKTYTEYEGVHFLEAEKYKKLIEETGLRITKQEKLHSLLPYPHILFMATKR